MRGRNRKSGRRRGRPGPEKRAQRVAEAQAARLLDPRTPAAEAAAILAEAFGGQPVDLVVADAIIDSGVGRARQIAEAALRLDPGPAARSFAADVALFDDEPEAAERHVRGALETLEHTDLSVRLALAQAGQGRIAAGTETLHSVAVEDPADEHVQLLTSEFVEMLAWLDRHPDAPCPCESGRRYETCCSGAGAAILARFHDERPLAQLWQAVGDFARERAELRAVVAADFAEWVSAGAVDGVTVERWLQGAGGDGVLHSLAAVRGWMAPALPGGDSVLDAFAAAPATPPELARRARQCSAGASWGLWLVEGPADGPGVWLTDCASRQERYVALAAGKGRAVRRWSVLAGCLVPVDGFWRPAGSLLALDPQEGSALAALVLNLAVELARELRERPKPMSRWASAGVEPSYGGILLADLTGPPPGPVGRRVQVTVAMALPKLVALLDPLRAELRDAGGELRDLLGPLAEAETEPGGVAARAWFAGWPDRPLAFLEGQTPRAAAAGDLALGVEAAIRLVEHHADRHGAALETEDLRLALGLLEPDDAEPDEDC